MSTISLSLFIKMYSSSDTDYVLHSLPLPLLVHLLVKAMCDRNIYIQGYCTVKEFVISLITALPDLVKLS